MDLVEAGTRHVSSGQRHPWEWARLAALESLMARHAPLRAGDVIIDVGCGDTFVAEQLAAQHPGIHIHAVDTAFTDDVLSALRARLPAGRISLHRSLDRLPELPAAGAALVLLMDVLEHVPDDDEFLRGLAARSFVSSTTRVVITVPAYPALFSVHDRLLGHYRRYTGGRLARTIAAAGLSVVERGHFFASLVPVRWLQSLRERIGIAVPRTSGLATWSRGPTLTRSLTAWLAADARLSLRLGRIGMGVPGLSLFAICRKSA